MKYVVEITKPSREDPEVQETLYFIGFRRQSRRDHLTLSRTQVQLIEGTEEATKVRDRARRILAREKAGTARMLRAQFDIP